MFVALILGLTVAVALTVIVLQRRQVRKPRHETYFSQTLGISDPASVPAQGEDENPRPL